MGMKMKMKITILIASSLFFALVLSVQVTSVEDKEEKFHEEKYQPLKELNEFPEIILMRAAMEKARTLHARTSSRKPWTHLNLRNCIGNKNGKLKKGGNFQKSSKECELLWRNPKTPSEVWFECKTKKENGKWTESMIDLNTIIEVVDGKLKC